MDPGDDGTFSTFLANHVGSPTSGPDRTKATVVPNLVGAAFTPRTRHVLRTYSESQDATLLLTPSTASVTLPVVNSNQFKRWLALHGCTFKPGKVAICGCIVGSAVRCFRCTARAS